MTSGSSWARPSSWTTARAYRNRHRTYARWLGVSASQTHRAWEEIQSDDLLFDRLRAVEQRFRDGGAPGFGASVRGHTSLERLVTRFRFSIPNAELYVLVRCLGPDRVVETGVASGISSSIILRALERNGRGRLTSVDLPIRSGTGSINADGIRDETHIPPTERPGWGIPDDLRSRWTLLEGDTRVRLVDAWSDGPRPSLFFHDSEHSFEVMDFEFRTAWTSLSDEGVLYADDIFWNAAFPRFARGLGVRPYDAVTPAGRGWLRKSHPRSP